MFEHLPHYNICACLVLQHFKLCLTEVFIHYWMFSHVNVKGIDFELIIPMKTFLNMGDFPC